MSAHETVNITINNKTIPVDKELSNVIQKLNSLGFETSGCCIGEKYNSYAWIIFQEIDEWKMLNLIKCFNDSKCAFILQKQFYMKHKDKTIYTQFLFKTPNVNMKQKINIISDWEHALNNFNIETDKFNYCKMKKLFEEK